MKRCNSMVPDIHTLIGVDVFLETRRTRTFVGRLTPGPPHTFIYDKVYVRARNSLALGPELPLTKETHTSKDLFPSFTDRLPSSENPAYSDYLNKFNLPPEERDPFVLLATIGSKGPSSFVFEPAFPEAPFQAETVGFRKKLGLTIRDFSIAFDVSTATILRIEKRRGTGRDALKRMELYVRFPETALFEASRNSSRLHSDVKEKLMEKLTQKFQLHNISVDLPWTKKCR